MQWKSNFLRVVYISNTHTVKLLSVLQLPQWTACPGDSGCLRLSGIWFPQCTFFTHADSNYWGEVLSFWGFRTLAIKHLPAKALGVPAAAGSTDLRVHQVFLQQSSSPVPSGVVRHQPWLTVARFCLCDRVLYWWDTLFLFFENHFQSAGCVVTHFSVATLQGHKVDKAAAVHLARDTFQLSFSHVPLTLKPSLHFSSNVSLLFCQADLNFVLLSSHAYHLFCKQLRVSRYDGRPLSSEDLLYSAVIEVTQRTPNLESDDATTLTLPVPEDGNVHLKIPVKEEAVMLLIRVGI